VPLSPSPLPESFEPCHPFGCRRSCFFGGLLFPIKSNGLDIDGVIYENFDSIRFEIVEMDENTFAFHMELFDVARDDFEHIYSLTENTPTNPLPYDHRIIVNGERVLPEDVRDRIVAGVQYICGLVQKKFDQLNSQSVGLHP
jgi:hypothetical protein